MGKIRVFNIQIADEKIITIILKIKIQGTVNSK